MRFLVGLIFVIIALYSFLVPSWAKMGLPLNYRLELSGACLASHEPGEKVHIPDSWGGWDLVSHCGVSSAFTIDHAYYGQTEATETWVYGPGWHCHQYKYDWSCGPY